jgi:hypothetical protein
MRHNQPNAHPVSYLVPPLTLSVSKAAHQRLRMSAAIPPLPQVFCGVQGRIYPLTVALYVDRCKNLPTSVRRHTPQPHKHRIQFEIK